MSKFILSQFFLLFNKKFKMIVFNSMRFKQEKKGLKEKWIINVKIMLQTAMNTLVINIIYFQDALHQYYIMKQ